MQKTNGSHVNTIPIFNHQPAEKPIPDSPVLYLHSLFYTLQGEGPLAGTPSVFVRLAGCNLVCPQCDTLYTGEGVRGLTSSELVEEVNRASNGLTKLVVITGGEPFRQPIGPFITKLLRLNYAVQVETNGTLCAEGVPYAHPRLVIVCSPKTGSVNGDLLPYIAAFKYVVGYGEAMEDGLPQRALGHTAHPHLYRPPLSWLSKPGNEIYVQPADWRNAAHNERNARYTAQLAMQHGYRLTMQLHKFIGLE